DSFAVAERADHSEGGLGVCPRFADELVREPRRGLCLWRDKQGENPATIKTSKPKPLSGYKLRGGGAPKSGPRRVIAAVPLRCFFRPKKEHLCRGDTEPITKGGCT